MPNPNRSLPGDPTTPRQDDVLAFIRTFTAAHGYAPSMREIGVAMEITSPNGVMAHLHALEKKGRIRRDPNTSRSIRVLGADPEGWVPAGRVPDRAGAYAVLYRPTGGGPVQAVVASFNTAKGWQGLPPGQRRSDVLFWSALPAGIEQGKD